MNTFRNPDSSECLAIPAPKLAELLGVSERHIWGLNALGLLPSPVRLGRAVRWDRAEIAAWLSAGAPPRDRWERIKTDNKQRR